MNGLDDSFFLSMGGIPGVGGSGQSAPFERPALSVCSNMSTQSSSNSNNNCNNYTLGNNRQQREIFHRKNNLIESYDCPLPAESAMNIVRISLAQKRQRAQSSAESRMPASQSAHTTYQQQQQFHQHLQPYQLLQQQQQQQQQPPYNITFSKRSPQVSHTLQQQLPQQQSISNTEKNCNSNSTPVACGSSKPLNKEESASTPTSPTSTSVSNSLNFAKLRKLASPNYLHQQLYFAPIPATTASSATPLEITDSLSFLPISQLQPQSVHQSQQLSFLQPLSMTPQSQQSIRPESGNNSCTNSSSMSNPLNIFLNNHPKISKRSPLFDKFVLPRPARSTSADMSNSYLSRGCSYSKPISTVATTPKTAGTTTVTSASTSATIDHHQMQMLVNLQKYPRANTSKHTSKPNSTSNNNTSYSNNACDDLLFEAQNRTKLLGPFDANDIITADSTQLNSPIGIREMSIDMSFLENQGSSTAKTTKTSLVAQSQQLQPSFSTQSQQEQIHPPQNLQTFNGRRRQLQQQLSQQQQQNQQSNLTPSNNNQKNNLPFVGIRNSLQIKNEATSFCDNLKPMPLPPALNSLRNSVQVRPPIVVPPILLHQQTVRGQQQQLPQNQQKLFGISQESTKHTTTNQRIPQEQQDDNGIILELQGSVASAIVPATTMDKRNENFDATFNSNARDKFFVSSKSARGNNSVNHGNISSAASENTYYGERAASSSSSTSACSVSSHSSSGIHRNEIQNNNNNTQNNRVKGNNGVIRKNENDGFSSSEAIPCAYNPTLLNAETTDNMIPHHSSTSSTTPLLLDVTSKFMSRMNHSKKPSRYTSLVKPSGIRDILNDTANVESENQFDENFHNHEIVTSTKTDTSKAAASSRRKEQFDVLTRSSRNTSTNAKAKQNKSNFQEEETGNSIRQKLTGLLRYEEQQLQSQQQQQLPVQYSSSGQHQHYNHQYQQYHSQQQSIQTQSQQLHQQLKQQRGFHLNSQILENQNNQHQFGWDSLDQSEEFLVQPVNLTLNH